MTTKQLKLKEKNNKTSVCILGSGSKGNCILIKNKETAFLIDSGFSKIEVERRLEKINVNPGCIKAILITHDHHDHVNGVRPFINHYKIPVYLNYKTYEGCASKLGDSNNFVYFKNNEPFQIGGFEINPIPVKHDAKDTVAFAIRNDNVLIGAATDLGCYDDYLLNGFAGANLLILESNHDKEKLLNGPYDKYLKDRIASDFGHLSNEKAAHLFSKLNHDRLKHLVLAHLSEENNTNKLVLDAFKDKIFPSTNLTVASQDIPSDILQL